MIDEKQLDLWEKATINGLYQFPDKVKELKEILHLARLGLWAQEKGIPALEAIQSDDGYGMCVIDYYKSMNDPIADSIVYRIKIARDVLTALPGKKGE